VSARGAKRRLAVALVPVGMLLVLLLSMRWSPTPGQPAGFNQERQEPEAVSVVTQGAPAPVASPSRRFANRPFGPPELRVLVRGENDQPIPGASAKASWPADPRPGYVVIGGPSFRDTEAITGPLGRLEVWGIPDGPVLVRAWADRFVPSNVLPVQVTRGTTTEVRVELSRGVGLEGEVRDEAGRPVPGAKVSVTELTGELPPSSLRWLGGGAAETDGAGRFLVNALGPGHYAVTAQLGRARGGLAIHVPSGRVLVRLAQVERRPGKVVGRILAPGVEASDLHCEVVTQRAGEEADWAGHSADGGFFSVDLPAGDYRLRTTCDRPAPGRDALAPVHVEEGRTVEVVMTTATGVNWPGLVVDDKGAPISDVNVRAELLGVESPRTTLHGSAFTTSDAHGAFVLSALTPARYSLYAWSGARYVQAEGSPGETLVLRLLPEPRVTGRTVDETGKPVKSYLLNGSRIEDDDGRFSRLRWTEGEELRFFAPGVGSAVISVPRRPGPQDLGTVVLEPMRKLAGRIVDAETGEPLAGALLEPGVEPIEAMAGYEHYNGGEDVVGSVRTDAEGRFAYPSAGSVPVLVSHPGHMRAEIHLEPGNNDVRLERGAVLEGRVAGAGEGTCVRAWSDIHGWQSVATGPGGTFRLEGVDRGEWVVRSGCEEQGEAARVQVDRPGSYSVVVPPPPGGTMDGR
jgi:Carboxypeptidase regulatory-like domain